MEDLLNKKHIRIIIGIVIAAPFTAGAIIFGLYGIIMGIGGIAEQSPVLLLLGLITISGLIGVSGAWRRLLKTTNEINYKEQNKIRTMLFFGLASALALLAWSIYFKWPLAITICVLISTLNVLFIYATPKKL